MPGVQSRRSWDITKGVKAALELNALIQKPGSSAENFLSRGDGPHRVFPFIAMKDNLADSETRTTCASRMLEDYQSPFDATVVRKIKRRSRGHKQFLRTNMDEFGMGSHSRASFFGPVDNVQSVNDISAGGSSGGSAVAVTTGAVDIALGTDTGGSVRLPAAYTGIVGFKPSYGRISRFGLVPYANSLDTVGLLGTRLDRVRRHFRRISGFDPLDPTSPSNEARDRFASLIGEHKPQNGPKRGPTTKKLRIGVPLEYNIEELTKPVRETWKQLLKRLRVQGHSIIPVSLPSTKLALSAYYVLAPAEAASNLSKYDGIRYGHRAAGSDAAGGSLYSQTRGEGFGAEVKRRILLGSYALSSEAIDNYFIQAQKVRRLVQNDFDRIFAKPNPLRSEQQFDLSDMSEAVTLENKLGPAQVDVIICPTAPTLPPKISELEKQTSVDSYMNDVFTVPASLAGLPAVSIPVSIRPDVQQETDTTKFVGMQVIGQYWDDSTVLAAGAVIEHLDDQTHRPCKTVEHERNDASPGKITTAATNNSAPSHSDFAPEILSHNLQVPNDNIKVRYHYKKLTPAADHLVRYETTDIVVRRSKSALKINYHHAKIPGMNSPASSPLKAGMFAPAEGSRAVDPSAGVRIRWR